MKILFYSNKCKHCKKLFELIESKNLKDDFKLVNVDNNKNVPKDITQVPTIFEVDLNIVLTGKKAFEYVLSQKYFNLQSNNINNWIDKNIIRPKIVQDKKAYNENSIRDNNEKIN